MDAIYEESQKSDIFKKTVNRNNVKLLLTEHTAHIILE